MAHAPRTLDAPDGRDSLQRFVFERARVRGELVRLEETWQEVLLRRDYPPALGVALGELMAASALLAATLKIDGGALVLQIQGGAPVDLLVVECQADLTLRAMARHDGGLDHLGPAPPLRALAAGGRCAITLDPGRGKPSYQGVVPLEGVTTTEVLERYMARSEQIETRFALAADGKHAAGLLLQRLPDRGGHAGAEEDSGLWEETSRILREVSRADLLDQSGAELLRRMFHAEPLRVFETMSARFGCRCSRDRVAGLLRLIGAEETRSVVAELGAAAVTCEFCSQRYVFTAQEAEAALADRSGRVPSRA